MKNITPCLWYDGKAEEAVNFYTTVIPNSKKGAITFFGENGPGEKGSVLTISFSLNGQEFMALNGGPEFAFTPAVSFIIDCETQEEIDWLWEELSPGGEKGQCGWLTDKFGVSWQIVPMVMDKLMAVGDASKSDAMIKAML